MSECAGLWIEGCRLKSRIHGIAFLGKTIYKASLHPGVYKLIPANIMLKLRQGVTL